jgi:hypothetical protein
VSASEIVRAKRETEVARRRLIETASELQERLRPGTIASNAWEGVKDKGGELADGAAEAVRARPVAVGSALAAFTLFLARRPIKSAVSRLFSGEADDDLVTTRLDGADDHYDLTAPVAARRKKEKEGAKK